MRLPHLYVPHIYIYGVREGWGGVLLYRCRVGGQREKDSLGSAYVQIEGQKSVKLFLNLCVYPILNTNLLC